MPVRYQLAGRIGVIHIDNPPVNALSHAVRAGLQAAIREAQDDESEACVIICAGRTFVAGADITEFGKPPQQPWLPDLLNELEASAKPVVAALHGEPEEASTVHGIATTRRVTDEVISFAAEPSPEESSDQVESNDQVENNSEGESES